MAVFLEDLTDNLADPAVADRGYCHRREIEAVPETKVLKEHEASRSRQQDGDKKKRNDYEISHVSSVTIEKI